MSLPCFFPWPHLSQAHSQSFLVCLFWHGDRYRSGDRVPHFFQQVDYKQERETGEVSGRFGVRALMEAAHA